MVITDNEGNRLARTVASTKIPAEDEISMSYERALQRGFLMESSGRL